MTVMWPSDPPAGFAALGIAIRIPSTSHLPHDSAQWIV